MKHNKAFKQFIKDCSNHISKNLLLNGIPFISEPQKIKKYSKTTSNSKIPNKFWIF